MTTTRNRPTAGDSDGAGPLPGQAGQVSEREARQVAEAARETEWGKPSFGKELFLGRFRLDLIDPWPQPDPDRTARAEEFLGRLERYLRSEVDGTRIERDAFIPDEVFHGLAQLGAFGMKIDRIVRRPGPDQPALLPGADAHRLGQPGDRRAAVGTPVDRRAATAENVRHRRAETALPAPTRRR